MTQLSIDAQLDPTSKHAWRPATLRLLLLLHYLLFGWLVGTQGVVWSDVQHSLVLSDGLFGTVMFATPLAGFSVLLLGGLLWKRWSLQQITIAGALMIAVSVTLLALSRSLAVILVARLLSGVSFAVLESGTNNAALDWEQHTGRGLVSTMYAAFSAGTVTGALVAGGLLSMGWTYTSILLTLVPAWFGAAAATALFSFPPRRNMPHDESGMPSGGMLRNQRFVLLAALCLVAMSGEALVEMWSVLYLRALGAGALISSAVFALFNTAMIGARLGNRTLVERIGARRFMVLAGGVAGSAAVLLGLGGVWFSAAAFVVLAVAVAGVVPTLLSAINAVLPQQREEATSGMIATSYLGFVVAPPLIGWASDAVGMHTTMAVATGLIAIALAGFGRSLRW